jgi:hypothetical protein
LKDIHGDKLQFYCDSNLNVIEEIQTQFAFDIVKFEIERLYDDSVNENTGKLQFFVNGTGFPI